MARESAVSAGPHLIVAGVCVASLGAAGLGAVTAADGESGVVMCPFNAATGLPCPFCGLTRSLFAAGDGRWADSFALSPLGPLVLVLAPLVLAWILSGFLRDRARAWPRPALATLALLVGASWTLQLAGAIT